MTKLAVMPPFDSNDFRDLDGPLGISCKDTEILAVHAIDFFSSLYIEAKEVQWQSQKKVKAMTDDPECILISSLS